jgi:antitoxin component of MazEF toxin-antitoxin module
MQTKVQKWGNSLAIRIPYAFAAEIGFGKDAEIEMRIVDGKLIVTLRADSIIEGTPVNKNEGLWMGAV